MEVNDGVHIFLRENRKAMQHAMGYRRDDPACNSRAPAHQISTLDLVLLAEINKCNVKLERCEFLTEKQNHQEGNWEEASSNLSSCSVPTPCLMV